MTKSSRAGETPSFYESNNITLILIIFKNKMWHPSYHIKSRLHFFEDDHQQMWHSPRESVKQE